jgi:hypothetical protein
MMRAPLVLLLVAACGDDGGSSTPDDGGPADSAEASCTGTCAVTSVNAMFTSTKTLTIAWYGVTAAENTLYVEVDLGGSTTCPEESSPTPDYSLVMGTVPIPTGTTSVMSGGAMLDYSTGGDLLGGPPVAQAMTITLTPDISNGPPSVPGAHLAFDITGTFTGGTVSGHLYALHCASMDE